MLPSSDGRIMQTAEAGCLPSTPRAAHPSLFLIALPLSLSRLSFSCFPGRVARRDAATTCANDTASCVRTHFQLPVRVTTLLVGVG